MRACSDLSMTRSLRLLTGPKVASFAEAAAVRLPVLHRGRGGVLVTGFEVYRPLGSADGGTSALGGIVVSPLTDH